MNRIKINGIKINGIKINGIKINRIKMKTKNVRNFARVEVSKDEQVRDMGKETRSMGWYNIFSRIFIFWLFFFTLFVFSLKCYKLINQSRFRNRATNRFQLPIVHSFFPLTNCIFNL
jgi:hypothetical protein